MRIEQLKSSKEQLKPKRNYVLAMYIAFVSVIMISYSVVTAVQHL